MCIRDRIEEEISELDDEERQMFLDDLGLKESGLEKLIKASYHLLGLMLSLIHICVRLYGALQGNCRCAAS